MKGNDGEYGSMLMLLYYTTSQLSIAFGLAEVRRTWTLQLDCSQFYPSHLGQGIRLVQDHQHESTHYRIMFCSAPAESSDELHPILLRGALLQLEAISAQGLRECACQQFRKQFILHLPVCNSITGIFHFYFSPEIFVSNTTCLPNLLPRCT